MKSSVPTFFDRRARVWNLAQRMSWREGLRIQFCVARRNRLRIDGVPAADENDPVRVGRIRVMFDWGGSMGARMVRLGAV